jgi:hypothetical protein
MVLVLQGRKTEMSGRPMTKTGRPSPRAAFPPEASGAQARSQIIERIEN